MFLVVWFALCVASVPLAGGKLARLGRQRLRRAWALSASLAL